MNNQDTNQFGLSLTQKLIWTGVPLLIALSVILYGPLLQGVVGTAIFVALGALLGLATWFVSAGWTFRLHFDGPSLRLTQSGRTLLIPLDRIGILVRNGGFPFPTLWIVLRGAEVGQEIPAGGVDRHAAGLIESFRKRSPGKKITFVPVPGGYLRSVTEFAAELKRRIPPVQIDERLNLK